jgi:VanZ family protein
MRSLYTFFTGNKTRTKIMAVLWTLLILAACLMPGKDVPDVAIPLADKWVHFIVFAGFSFLWLCVPRKVSFKTGFLLFLLSMIFGYIIELLQDSGITQGRSYDLNDVLADTIGGILGILLFFLVRALAVRPT